MLNKNSKFFHRLKLFTYANNYNSNKYNYNCLPLMFINIFTFSSKIIPNSNILSLSKTYIEIEHKKTCM